jgi:hypothetical protein
MPPIPRGFQAGTAEIIGAVWVTEKIMQNGVIREEAMDDVRRNSRKRRWVRCLVFLVMLPVLPFMLKAAGPALFRTADLFPSLMLGGVMVAFAVLVGVALGMGQTFQALNRVDSRVEETSDPNQHDQTSDAELNDLLPDCVNR